MTLLGLILSVFFPLCGTYGATGVPAPGVIDFTHFDRLGHSEFLMGPPGFFQHPNQETPIFNLSPAVLFSAVQATAEAQPRTYELDTEPQALQAAYVVRTAIANFPDIIEVAIIAEPGNKSGLVFYSHSVYGAGDYGMNHKHAVAWLQTLNSKVPR